MNGLADSPPAAESNPLSAALDAATGGDAAADTSSDFLASTLAMLDSPDPDPPVGDLDTGSPAGDPDPPAGDTDPKDPLAAIDDEFPDLDDKAATPQAKAKWGALKSEL